jgi:KaiC/GvpD/RAD55 family RecA-like ATPase
MTTDPARLSSGVDGLDDLLGGGYLPGTLTVVLGATGIGKTQLGLHFAAAGAQRAARRGVIFDMSSRLDSQAHAEYARRMFDWRLEPGPSEPTTDFRDFFGPKRRHGDYLHVFDYRGHAVDPNRDADERHRWQVELAHKLSATVSFFYGNFTSGARRVVVDGVEPAERPADSIQLELFEYIYHQVLRKDSQWLARDVFRQHYRHFAELAEEHAYDSQEIGCLLLCTAHETMLDHLLERPLADGDLLSNANTLIYMGKVREGGAMTRGLCVAKHRGSACREEVARFRIDRTGIVLE